MSKMNQKCYMIQLMLLLQSNKIKCAFVTFFKRKLLMSITLLYKQIYDIKGTFYKFVTNRDILDDVSHLNRLFIKTV